MRELRLAVPFLLPIFAWVDERRMSQAITGVVSNAVKFTPSGGTVRVSLALDGEGRIRISVSDTGIGIAAEQIARITQPFEQVEDAYARSHGGTGLGLALARKWLELHGGTIELKSVMGEGTTVNLYVPAWRCESAGHRSHAAAAG